MHTSLLPKTHILFYFFLQIKWEVSDVGRLRVKGVTMSRHIITAGPKHDPLSELDIDELVERLTPGTKTWQELVERLQAEIVETTFVFPTLRPILVIFV